MPMREKQYRKKEIIGIIRDCSARLRYVDISLKGRKKRQIEMDGIGELEHALEKEFERLNARYERGCEPENPRT